MGDENQKWIEERYGPIELLERQVMVRGENKTFFISSVPVMKGVCFGIGFTRAESMESLKRDLSGPTKGAA